ncbi:glycosyltransferase family 4 protein [Aurantiacibacter gangjinensis]|uniref:Glycosyl transferase family 1 n=1 Tax=Aurantiacibacter gangjinensis TaxID=502682 RepID=A0A0G9MRT7_9SPHN|nr:glycosyltransferase family 1 protein [Aurantiacibacter gangjinensis]APE26970.1 Glycosyltransferase [Aurantiacibacter gangjinensis]KLE33420.1 glycosyl transferase family 1 [Aurantiacibacter gangjinensis]
MDVSDLRVALFSGNYNYVRDGANQALNRLVDYLLRQGAKVRVYSPTTDTPAFEPAGELVSLPSVPIPGRSEYQFSTHLGSEVKANLAEFDPHIVHISSPDIAGHRALSWARGRGTPVLASVHTRFETYPRYYGLGFTEPLLVAMLRRFYHRCDAIVAPSPSMIAELREQGMHCDIGTWSRGVDRSIFSPDARDVEWRQSLGIGEDDMAIGFLGRLVLEKGLDIFADTMVELRRRGVAHKVLVIGEGPAKGFFEEKVPEACFVGFQQGKGLGRAVASMDVLLNPSVTETFGNVTLEAMACGVPVIAADATGASSLVVDGETGHLVPPRDVSAYADKLQAYAQQPDMRRAHGAAGARRADEFDWDTINGAVADTYLRLIAQRARAGGKLPAAPACSA